MISAEKNQQQMIRQEIAKLVGDYAKLEFTQKKFDISLYLAGVYVSGIRESNSSHSLGKAGHNRYTNPA